HPVPLEADPKPTTVSSASLQQQPRDEASPLETRSDHQEPSDASSSVDGQAHSLESEQLASLPTATPDSPVVANSAAADSETPVSQDASDADTVPPSAQQQVRSNVCADTAVLAPVATANDTAACGLHPTAQDASDANVMPASTQQQIQSDHDMDAVLSPPVDEATSNATAETAMAVTPAAAMAEAARAFYIRHKTRAPNATVTRPRQQIPHAALSLNRIAVTRLRNPHDSSKSIKRVIPIRGRQQLTPKARSKATRVDLRHLGLGLGKINPVAVKHRVVNATSTVRPSGGLALRDNRLRRRRRVYSALLMRRQLSLSRLLHCRLPKLSSRLFLHSKPLCCLLLLLSYRLFLCRRLFRLLCRLLPDRRLSRRLFLCRQSLQFSRRLFLYRKPSCH
ncbi:hypothetical protein GGI06_001462, partial [Coemansia sp. S85]